MRKPFLTYLKEHSLLAPGQKVLVATSGGMDSMCLLSLFMQVKEVNIGVAHCNFSLRGAESDQDQAFVKQFCEQRKLPFYAKRFNTLAYAKSHGISTQMAARDLRYQWFTHLCKEHQFQKVAVGTHWDDNVETYLINLCRGTGLKGLTGIKPMRDHIIRPLLLVGRSKIAAYVQKHHIPFREDSSNATDHYLRNNIRHHVLPLLNKIYPGASENISKNSEHLNAYEQFINKQIGVLKTQYFQNQKEMLVIEKKLLDAIDHNYAILYELVQEYGFTTTQVKDLMEAKDRVGARFYTSTHTFYVERTELHLIPNENQKELSINIKTITDKVQVSGLSLSMSLINRNSFNLSKYTDASTFACLDYDKVSFPLKIEDWKAGDRFSPLGLGGEKKVADFLSDLKVSHIQKEKALLLKDASKEVLWVLGYRISNKHKLSDNTKRVLLIEFQANPLTC